MSRPTSRGAGTQQHRGSVTFGADSGPAGPSSRGHDGHVYGAIKAPSHQLAGQVEPGQGLTGQEEAMTQDDYHAILSVHGFDTVADATVIDLHETGIRTVAPLAVFSNAQVRFNDAACAFDVPCLQLQLIICVACPVQIMFLHNNAIESLDLIWHCTNLVKLVGAAPLLRVVSRNSHVWLAVDVGQDLAHNNISTLPSGAQLGCLRQLSLLYLHNNNIQTWDAIGALAALPSLTLLTMHDNPVAAHPKFRHYVVNKVRLQTFPCAPPAASHAALRGLPLPRSHTCRRWTLTWCQTKNASAAARTIAWRPFHRCSQRCPTICGCRLLSTTRRRHLICTSKP